MSRYKGRTGTKLVERDFPFIVEMAVPLGGFGKTLDAMFEFHTRNGIRASIQPGDAMRMAAIISGGALLIGK